MKKPFYRRKAFWIVFGVPNLISIAYFLAIAAPKYVSQASIIVYQAKSGSDAGPVTLKLGNATGGVSTEGDYLAAKYARSWDCFTRQNPDRMRAAWEKGDFVSRFGGLLDGFRSNPTTLWHYYQSHVVTAISTKSSIMTVRVTGYNPDFVHNLNESVLASAGKAINAMNEQATVNAEGFFKSQVATARKQLHADIEKLAALQAQGGVVDPGTDYKAKLSLLNSLLVKRAEIAAQISAISTATPGSRSVANLKAEIAALNSEVTQARKAVSGTPAALTGVAGNFQYISSLIKNDETALETSEGQMLAARQAALQHQYFIENVGAPTRPINPTLPERWIDAGVVFFVTFFLYLIVK